MSNFKEIDVHKAKELISKGNVTIVDIRDENSYQEKHIHTAHHIDNTNLDKFIEKTDKQKPLICYCYHGFSSQQAAAYFVQNGFKEVYSISGGFEAWSSIQKDI